MWRNFIIFYSSQNVIRITEEGDGWAVPGEKFVQNFAEKI